MEKKRKKILVTSALLYVNGLPHLGHIVGCWLPGDVFTRFNKTVGNDVIYVSGTDDHGTTSYMSAKEIGMEPEEFISLMNGKVKEIAKKLDIGFDIFSGTNTKTHEETTIDFFNEINKNYKKKSTKMVTQPNLKAQCFTANTTTRHWLTVLFMAHVHSVGMKKHMVTNVTNAGKLTNSMI